jgi:hypothetical protein
VWLRHAPTLEARGAPPVAWDLLLLYAAAVGDWQTWQTQLATLSPLVQGAGGPIPNPLVGMIDRAATRILELEGRLARWL